MIVAPVMPKARLNFRDHPIAGFASLIDGKATMEP
jgi:hypothetical protein